MTQQSDITHLFGRRVASLRAARGWTQAECASRCDISINYLGNIERGEYNATLQIIARLAAGFEVTPAELFDFSQVK